MLGEALIFAIFLANKVYELAKQAWLGLGDFFFFFHYGVQVGALAATHAWPFSL